MNISKPLVSFDLSAAAILLIVTIPVFIAGYGSLTIEGSVTYAGMIVGVVMMYLGSKWLKKQDDGINHITYGLRILCCAYVVILLFLTASYIMRGTFDLGNAVSFSVYSVVVLAILFRYSNPYPNWARVVLTFLLLMLIVFTVDVCVEDYISCLAVMFIIWPLFVAITYLNGESLEKAMRWMNSGRWFTDRDRDRIFNAATIVISASIVISVLLFVETSFPSTWAYEPLFPDNYLELLTPYRLLYIATFTTVSISWMLWARKYRKCSDSEWMACAFTMITISMTIWAIIPFFDHTNNIVCDALLVIGECMDMASVIMIIIHLHKKKYTGSALFGLIIYAVLIIILAYVECTVDFVRFMDSYNYGYYLILDYLIARGFVGVPYV